MQAQVEDQHGIFDRLIRKIHSSPRAKRFFMGDIIADYPTSGRSEWKGQSVRYKDLGEFIDSEEYDRAKEAAQDLDKAGFIR